MQSGIKPLNQQSTSNQCQIQVNKVNRRAACGAVQNISNNNFSLYRPWVGAVSCLEGATVWGKTARAASSI